MYGFLAHVILYNRILFIIAPMAMPGFLVCHTHAEFINDFAKPLPTTTITNLQCNGI